MKLVPGSIFARDFRIASALAEGGMGEVYAVEQLSTGKRRALKVMQPALIPDARARERFVLEARIGSQIESEHIVDVVASGIDEPTGMPWIAMELLEGVDLAEYLKQRGHLPPAEAYEVLAQLCDGLGAAHARGIVHRDLKPENVFISVSRRRGVPFTVKILDFGIAKVTQDNQTSATGTSAMGSPLWMAPEQTESGTRLRPATDVWALGLIAFWLLTGRSYWRAGNQAEIALTPVFTEVLVLPLDPPSVRAAQMGLGHLVPPAFDAWFYRCVVRDHDQRFVDATQAISALSPHFSILEASSARRMIPATIAMPSIVPDAIPSSVSATPIPRTSGYPAHYVPQATEPTPPFSVPAVLGGSIPPGVPVQHASMQPQHASMQPQSMQQAPMQPQPMQPWPQHASMHPQPMYPQPMQQAPMQPQQPMQQAPMQPQPMQQAPMQVPHMVTQPGYASAAATPYLPRVTSAPAASQGTVRWGILGALGAAMVLGALALGVVAWWLFRDGLPVTPPPALAAVDAAVPGSADAVAPVAEDAGVDAAGEEVDAGSEGHSVGMRGDPRVGPGGPTDGPTTPPVLVGPGGEQPGETDPPQGSEASGETFPDGADRRFSGTWSGEGWRYRLMIDLSREGSQVSGAIRWTLAETPDEMYTARVGETATEYVRGTYAPPGLLSLDGQSVTDDSLISADHYDLHLAADGSIVGVAREGGGRLSARMLEP